MNISQKKKFLFAIKFNEFTLEEIAIPAHILGNFTLIIHEFCKFTRFFLHYYIIYGIFLLSLTKNNIFKKRNKKIFFLFWQCFSFTSFMKLYPSNVTPFSNVFLGHLYCITNIHQDDEIKSIFSQVLQIDHLKMLLLLTY
jgi:hypothetical protein